MDAVQFGRWLGERRHARGWPSQRALAEAAHADPLTRADGDAADLSEAFLARLEAGHLAHPFRGLVRQRVLALAWLLCKTPRDVRGYLRAAGLTELSREETARMERLMRHLAPMRGAAPVVLPPRPPRLMGREADLAELWRALTAGAGDKLVAITGMPGSGKSALAAEMAHRLAERAREEGHAFPDGVVWLSGTGRRGARGLADLLDELAAMLAAAPAENGAAPGRSPEEPHDEAAAGRAQGRASARGAWASAALGERRMLFVLDDLDAAFPLAAALAALLAREAGMAGAVGAAETGEGPMGQRAVLLTSRFRPAPALLTAHRHLDMLAPEAALALFTALAGHSLTDAEREAAALICAALGHLPVAIEAAATAAFSRGIALPLLAARISERPLDALLDGDGALRARLARALEPLPEAIQHRFTLLGALGATAFGLEPVAAIQSAPPLPALAASADGPDGATQTALTVVREALQGGPVPASEAVADRPGGEPAHLDRLAAVAGELGQLVQHSLLAAMPSPAIAPRFAELGAQQLRQTRHEGQTRYQMHPVLSAYALDRLEQLDPEVAHAARRDAQAYALALVARHQGEPRLLERERDLLLAVLARAWQGEEFGVVVQLVAGLWHLVSRAGSYALAARTLVWGITASERLNDRYHLARFMGRLGSLLYYHGEAEQARHTWEASLRIAEQLRGSGGAVGDLWQPLASLAMLACAEGDFASAQRLAETYLRRAEDHGGIPAVAGALFKRGVLAHLEGDLDQAYADLNACTRLLALRGAGETPSHDGIFEMAAQAELARVQGDFARAQHHTELAVALAEEVCDHYMVADLLLDQARFARLQERQEEARLLARRVVEVASQVEAHRLRLDGLSLLRQLPDAAKLLSSPTP